MPEHLIFIYGSLRSGSESPMTSRFPEAKIVGEATVRGTLYDLDEYPGLRPDESGSLVTGETYAVDDAVLKTVDEFEAASEYSRKRIQIHFGLETKWGWTYVPDPKVLEGRTAISSGDWLEHSRSMADGAEMSQPKL